MTKEDLFNWASDNLWEYPSLNYLREEVVDNVHFLILPGQRGAYKGLYLCFYENSAVSKLRGLGYAVGVIDSYHMAKILILDCAKFIKKWEAEKRKLKSKNNQEDCI